ncbi:hypothetical protein DD55_22120, partial [Salmonella enterica subsp. enterica serovar Saintpaul]
DVTLKMPAFEWVHVQLHQQKGMISLSPPTICNSAKQETQLKREAQHPLTHGLFRQYFINQQGGTFGHPPRPTARAETATLTAESDQVLGVARLAANP